MLVQNVWTCYQRIWGKKEKNRKNDSIPIYSSCSKLYKKVNARLKKFECVSRIPCTKCTKPQSSSQIPETNLLTINLKCYISTNAEVQDISMQPLPKKIDYELVLPLSSQYKVTSEINNKSAVELVNEKP